MKTLIFIILFFVSGFATAEIVTVQINWSPPCSPYYTNAAAQQIPIAGYLLFQVDMMTAKTTQTGIGVSATSSKSVSVDTAHWYLFFMRTSYADNVISPPSDVIQWNNNSSKLLVSNTQPCP